MRHAVGGAGAHSGPADNFDLPALSIYRDTNGNNTYDAGTDVLVTYADEWRGHSGAVCRADNWQYQGRTKPERTYQINGRMTARKAGRVTRTHAEMLALGAEMVGAFAKHKFVFIRRAA